MDGRAMDGWMDGEMNGRRLGSDGDGALEQRQASKEASNQVTTQPSNAGRDEATGGLELWRAATVDGSLSTIDSTIQPGPGFRRQSRDGGAGGAKGNKTKPNSEPRAGSRRNTARGRGRAAAADGNYGIHTTTDTRCCVALRSAMTNSKAQHQCQRQEHTRPHSMAHALLPLPSVHLPRPHTPPGEPRHVCGYTRAGCSQSLAPAQAPVQSGHGAARWVGPWPDEPPHGPSSPSRGMAAYGPSRPPPSKPCEPYQRLFHLRRVGELGVRAAVHQPEAAGHGTIRKPVTSFGSSPTVD